MKVIDAEKLASLLTKKGDAYSGKSAIAKEEGNHELQLHWRVMRK